MVLYCSYYWTSIKPVNWTAILAATQSNQSTGQPSWQSLNQTSQLDSHPGSHSIKPGNWTGHSIKSASESWRPVGRLEGVIWEGGSPPQEVSDDGYGFPTTLDIWRSPGPTCQGTKYPVRESLTSIWPLTGLGIDEAWII